MDFVTEKHFEKLEKKVEKVEDKVDSLKEDVIELSSNISHHIQMIKSHVDSDNKIITEILPTLRELNVLLPDLRNIVLEKKSDEIQDLKSTKVKNSWKLNLSIGTAIIALLGGIIGFVTKYFKV